MRNQSLVFSRPTLRPLRWLVDVSGDRPEPLRLALIRSLYGTLPLFFGGALNTLVVTILITVRHPNKFFITWLIIEIVIFISRLTTIRIARRAAAARNTTPTDLYLSLSLLWAANSGVGTWLSLTSDDWQAAALACLCAAAMAGGICFRNFAAPRLASVMILLSIGPVFFAGFLLGEPILLLTMLTMPFYLISMSIAAFNLNTMLTATMQAEYDNALRASQDALTSLFNRSGLAVAMSGNSIDTFASRRYDVLLYLDLDGFKQINDTHGHQIGDRLLCAVASRLRALVNYNDVAARIGGDEFVILAEAASHPDLPEFCDRIVTEISNPYSGISDKPVVVGVSVGVALARTVGDDLDSLIGAADAGLYRAKSLGKARWSFAPVRPIDDPAPGKVVVPTTMYASPVPKALRSVDANKIYYSLTSDSKSY